MKTHNTIKIQNLADKATLFDAELSDEEMMMIVGGVEVGEKINLGIPGLPGSLKVVTKVNTDGSFEVETVYD